MGERPNQTTDDAGHEARIDAFTRRWQGREGGQERANYALFLTELCTVLDLPPPDPASAGSEDNDYVFERVVREIGRDGVISNRRIDLYRRGAFVLEAKQSRQKGGRKEIEGQGDLLPFDLPARGRRGADRAWDVLMMNARQQAEAYVRLLPPKHAPPPFVIVCDVGRCFEVYANFRRDGKAYDQFPDRQSFRIYIDDLSIPAVRARLVAMWTDPASLDPARRSARVTREIAERLAAVSKALEAEGHAPQEVAMFLMRCLFTMFAEDIGLLPDKSFKIVLERCEADPEKFAPMVGQLWEAMDKGGFAHAIECNVRQFNGEFFKTRTVLPLGREEIGELRQAATYDWRDVDPSIFGTLVEQALDPIERQRLGAHYTPRAYVERLVIATVIEPLRDDWRKVLSTAERHQAAKRNEAAISTVREFHRTLCAVRILDPACGTGNFLYVALELAKRLEGEVLEALLNLGGEEALTGLTGHTVDPHQFMGLELNTRAAAIAELVLWIGHLQWHARTKGGVPAEPILKAFKNIVVQDAVLSADVALAKPNPQQEPGARSDGYEYRNPRRAVWPQAEFIVGNPPFIGGKRMRDALGDQYVEALWAANPEINKSADFVMFWWDRAVELLGLKGTTLRQVGLVSTNSISQIYNRRAVEKRLKGRSPVSIVMAIPDHPWTKASKDAASVRIAMTVLRKGSGPGRLLTVTHEEGLDTDSPMIALSESTGVIHANLRIGANLTDIKSLKANAAICQQGVKLVGEGFIVEKREREYFEASGRSVIKGYLSNKELVGHHRERAIIDFFGLDADQARSANPAAYQRVLELVKPLRDKTREPSRRKNWWLFGRSNIEMRSSIDGLDRFIATPEVAKHRPFVFLDAKIVVDASIYCIALNDAFHLGVLSSRIHQIWSRRAGGTLEDRPRYHNTTCFDPFAFPATTEKQKAGIRAIAEDIDALRKNVITRHPDLTITGLYNVLEAVRGGARSAALDLDDRHILDAGLILILKELHDKLDASVADAYGWPADLAEDETLARLVALNQDRANEEANGHIHWLRPEYQAAKFTKGTRGVKLDLTGVDERLGYQDRGKPTFPTDGVAQTTVVMAALADALGPLDSTTIAAQFRQGRRIEPAITATLTAIARMGFIVSGVPAGSFILRRGA